MSACSESGSGDIREHVPVKDNPGLGVSGLPEILLISCLLLMAELALPGPASLASISPHPLWILVLLVSIQYGTTSGLAAATAAIAASWIAGWPEQSVSEDYYGYFLRIWREPTLWLIAAVVLGEMRNRWVREHDDLQHRLAEAESQRQSIADFCAELQQHSAAVERQIATTRDRSIDTGMASLWALGESTSASCGQALADAVMHLFGPARYTLFLRREDGFVRALQADGPLGSEPVYAQTAELTVCQAVAREYRQLSVLREEDAKVLEHVGVFAGPIVSSSDEPVFGVLLLEQVDPDRLNPGTESALSAITVELSHALFHRNRGIASDCGVVGVGRAQRWVIAKLDARNRTLEAELASQACKADRDKHALEQELEKLGERMARMQQQLHVVQRDRSHELRNAI